MKPSKKIIQEAIQRELLNENPFAGAIAGVKGAVGGVKGTFQNMGANYRLSNVGSQMDQFAKKSKKAWDINSQKAQKQIDKMKNSSNQDVAAAAQTVDQQLTQADQQIGQALNFVSNGVARTMIAAGGSSSQQMNQNSTMGTQGMEKNLTGKGIYPKMIGKKEYLQVVDLMQKISQIGGMQSLSNFEREMIKKGIRPDRLGKREYGVEVINHLENEYLKLLSSQQQQAQPTPGPQTPNVASSNLSAQAVQSPQAPQANTAPANPSGLRPRPNFSNSPAPAVPSPAIQNQAPSGQHQPIQPTKKGYGVDKRFSTNQDDSNPQPKNFGTNAPQAVAQAATGGEDSEDFSNIVGKIQSSPEFNKSTGKSWKGKSSNLFPKVGPEGEEEAPAPQEEQSYSSQHEPNVTGTKGDTAQIHNIGGQDKSSSYFNKGRSQLVGSDKLSKSQLSQQDPRYSPYAATDEAPAEPLPLISKKQKGPPPVPPEAKKRKFPKVQKEPKSVDKSVERILGKPTQKISGQTSSEKSTQAKQPKGRNREDDVSMYYRLLQQSADQGKELKPNELADLKAWKSKKQKK